MGERRNWRINEVPRTVLSELALLADAEATVRNLLNNLRQFLSSARLSTNELPCARLQCCCMTNEHHVSRGWANGFQDESSDVKHPLVELQVCFVWLQVLQCHLGDVTRVDAQAALAELCGRHERGESPSTPRQPLKKSVLDFQLDVWVLKALGNCVGCLHTPQCWGAVDVLNSDTLLSHALRKKHLAPFT